MSGRPRMDLDASWGLSWSFGAFQGASGGKVPHFRSTFFLLLLRRRARVSPAPRALWSGAGATPPTQARPTAQRQAAPGEEGVRRPGPIASVTREHQVDREDNVGELHLLLCAAPSPAPRRPPSSAQWRPCRASLAAARARRPVPRPAAWPRRGACSPVAPPSRPPLSASAPPPRGACAPASSAPGARLGQRGRLAPSSASRPGSQ